jgi:N-acetylmuramoyl-L-alanine amidase
MKLKFLVIHCSATPYDMRVTPNDIRSWHLSPPPVGRGWSQIGYSDMILLDGSLVNLVPYNEDQNIDRWEITNGVAGINSQSRHIVYVGGTDKRLKALDTRTDAQEETMRIYVLKTIALHPDILVAGHNQFSKKDCPSFDVPKWCASVGIPFKNVYHPVTVL